ncbi:MAG TPA: hypothetical protein VGH87_13990 [Polyangiaceae bacterium]
MRVVFILAPIAVVGCAALTSLDDLSQGQSDASGADVIGSDAIPSDGGGGNDVVQTSDAGDASDGGGNLLTNGGFENGNGGCGTNWGNGYGMTFTRVSPGHTGNSACVVCTNGSNSDSYQLDAVATIPVHAGNYYAEAWLGTPWDGGVATANAGVQVYFVGDAGTISGCIGDGTSYCQGSFVSGPPWSTSSVTFVVAGSGAVMLDVHSYDGTASSCFAVDDVALYAQ